MRRTQRIVLLITLALAVPALSGCANFDPDSLDVFGLNDKKKLPGDRRAVFPEGVPGVSQGIPPEYLKGNQPLPENAVIIPPEPEKPAARKSAAAPKRVAKPRAAAQRRQPAAAQQPAPNQPWPEQQPAPPAQSSGAAAPWPNAAPAPGTFSR